MGFDFYAFITEAEQRKRELGLSDDAAASQQGWDQNTS
jgi:hypothetical protein